MVSPKLSPAFDDFLDYLVQKVTPEAILAYQASKAAQKRTAKLLERSSAGEVTPEELIELEHVQQAIQLESALKARALQILNKT